MNLIQQCYNLWNNFSVYHSLGWDIVDFFHKGSHKTVCWIFKKVVVITHQYSSCHRQHLHRVFPAFHAAGPVRRLEVQQELEGTQPGQLVPADHRVSLYRCAEARIKKEGAGDGSDGVCLPKSVCLTQDRRCLFYTWWAWLSCRWLDTCLLMGSTKWIPCFALLACAAFVLPSQLSVSQPRSSHTFTSPILFPIPPGEGERAAV